VGEGGAKGEMGECDGAGGIAPNIRFDRRDRAASIGPSRCV
jgi:hypothetical protein